MTNTILKSKRYSPKLKIKILKLFFALHQNLQVPIPNTPLDAHQSLLQLIKLFGRKHEKHTDQLHYTHINRYLNSKIPIKPEVEDEDAADEALPLLLVAVVGNRTCVYEWVSCWKRSSGILAVRPSSRLLPSHSTKRRTAVPMSLQTWACWQ